MPDLYELNPLEDARWEDFVRGHPAASVFHTAGWLEALRRTYGYEPVVFTTSPPGAELTNGVVFCRVRSWLTGRRLVSLPFSDHCEPLLDDPNDLSDLLRWLKRDAEKEGLRYVEIRTLSPVVGTRTGFEESQRFYFHKVDLRPPLQELFNNLHKTSCRAKIRHAERAGLVYEEGRSEPLLKKFYALLLQTRRRQKLPPQPLDWFRNLITCLEEGLKIRVASKDDIPIASLLTLRHRNTIVDKYGCSDARFHKLGGVPFLFWKTIQEAKALGLSEFDIGRSDCDNEGLVTFKERWGATRSTLIYYRYPAGTPRPKNDNWKMQVAKQVFARAPDGLLTAAGNFLYRHVG